jgi:hypothetical protein
MMGERIAGNMYSRLEINKSRIIASYWSSFIIVLVMHGHMNIKPPFLSLQFRFNNADTEGINGEACTKAKA